MALAERAVAQRAFQPQPGPPSTSMGGSGSGPASVASRLDSISEQAPVVMAPVSSVRPQGL